MADTQYTVSVNITAKDLASTAIGQVERGIKGLAPAGMSAVTGVNALAGGITDFHRTITGLPIVELLSDLNAVGEGANKTERSFTSLIGGAEAAAQAMNAMRAGTGGIVSDIQLAAGANQLLLTGIASGTDELAQFTSGAVRLGGAMGQDAAEAIQNFSAAILNMSFARLDTLGLSAATVRQRMNELMDSGEALNRSDAFKSAVIFEMGNSLNRLGSAADAAITPLARLQTGLTNAWTDIGQGVNSVLNQGIQAGDQLIQILDYVLQDAVTTNEEIHSLVTTISKPVMASDTGVIDKHGILAAGSLPTAAEQADIESGARRRARIQSEAYWGAYEEFYGSVGMQALGNTQDTIVRMTAFGQQQRLQAMEDAQAEFDTFMADSGVNRFMTPEDAQAIQDQVAELERLADLDLISDSDVDAARGIADEASRAADAFSSISLSDVFGQAGGGMMGEMTDRLMRYAEEQGMGETDLENLQRTLDLASGRQTEASLAMDERVVPMLEQIQEQFGDEAVADAMGRISTFLEQAALAGLSAEQIAAALPEATGYMSTGQGYGGFTVGAGDTVSGIAARTGMTQAQIMAAAGITDPRALQIGSYTGQSSLGMIPGYNMDMLLGGGMQGTFQGPGGMPGGGLNPENFQDINAGIADIKGNIEGMQEPASALASSFGDVKTNVETVKADLTEVSAGVASLTEGVKTIRLNLDILDPTGRLAILQGLGLVPNFNTGSSVRDNGGRVDGMDTRTQ